jgi:hypothetical protein
MGTIRAQREFFRRAGVDTERLYDGTINVDISPLQFEPIKPSLILRHVRWHPTWAPETFSLFTCKIVVRESEHDGFVYFPHPDTKPTIFPGHHIAEVAHLLTALDTATRLDSESSRTCFASGPRQMSLSRADGRCESVRARAIETSSKRGLTPCRDTAEVKRAAADCVSN